MTVVTVFEGVGAGVQNTVTIDTHRHGRFQRVLGTLYKRVPERGVVRRQRGSAPCRLAEPTVLCSRQDESTIVGYYTLKK